MILYPLLVPTKQRFSDVVLQRKHSGNFFHPYVTDFIHSVLIK